MKHKMFAVAAVVLMCTLSMYSQSNQSGTANTGPGSQNPPERRNGVGFRVAGTRPPDVSPVLGQPLETREPFGPGQKPAFEGQTRAIAVATKTPLDAQIVAHGLQNPWALAFLPDGKMLVTEKPGAMRVVTRDGVIGEPIAGVPPVVFGGDGGLLDVALDPAFATNRMIYFTYVEPREGGSGVALAKARLSDDAKKLENLTVIMRVQPAVGIPAHFGSRLLFDKEGKLFVSLGERFFDPTRGQAQALDSMMGKILRLNTDGTAAPDNPFAKKPGALPEIWSYGQRNPQGLGFNPKTGDLWDVEHGPQGGDEVNLIRPGHNYGWPVIAYGEEYDGRPINGGRTAQEGMEQPLYYWNPAIGPTGMTFYSGSLIPEWDGNLFVAGHNGEHIARLVLDGNRVVGEERLLLDQRQRMRDVRQGPDGALWVLTDDRDGRLVRIAPRSAAPLTVAQGRTEITINDTNVGPENLTSSQDGAVYFGSTRKGIIYRALPGAAQAEAWIPADANGLINVLGVLADDKANTLWVCANAPFGPGAPAGRTPELRAYDLKTGAAKGAYPFPNGGLANDIAVAADGTAYVSDTMGGRVFRLKPGATSLDVWVNDTQLRGVDGLSFLADGALYVNNYFSGKLSRIPVKPDGSAGPIAPLETSVPIERPDGLRTVGPKTLIQAEGSGQVTEITIEGNRAEVRVVKDKLNTPAGVTVMDGTAFIVINQTKAVAAPYRLGMSLPAARVPSVAVANPTYVSISLETMVDRPAADVWKRVGKYCDINEWMRIPCTITSGKDGEIGTVRTVAGNIKEVLVGKTELSYTYVIPVREGRPYDLFHGTLEARPVTATTSKLVYTLILDNSMLADDEARQADIERRRGMFTQSLQNMKILAEGGALPPTPARGGRPGGGRPPGRE